LTDRVPTFFALFLEETMRDTFEDFLEGAVFITPLAEWDFLLDMYGIHLVLVDCTLRCH